MSEDNNNNNNKIHLPIKIFNCQEVKKRIHEILHDNLHDKQYDLNQCNFLAKNLSNIIKNSLKTFGYERYKFIIQIIICQQHNENLQMISRSYWDSETDKFAQSIYINQFLICVATAFAVFYY
ncbi:unnamed protein product [Rotaria sordida]|uniref:Uncharacterized protein n=1 Tax=Rotaria sordida TaxID=392033 RepID=A0A818UNG6_9BILA|nr:unnamed protein product [Rotaria sordida]CAF1098318.1 unnamed protein product [Rotaria sordida]CAF1371775.1 unnamed protein product [Rotaria sordida]CAF3703177.1 unnamed protein product [Rotaria sordida]